MLAFPTRAQNVTCLEKDLHWHYFDETFSTCIIYNQTIDEKNFIILSPMKLKIEAFTISNDKGVQFAPSNVGDSLPQLKVFQVTNCSLKSVSRLAMRSLSGLIELDLSENEITRNEANSARVDVV